MGEVERSSVFPYMGGDGTVLNSMVRGEGRHSSPDPTIGPAQARAVFGSTGANGSGP